MYVCECVCEYVCEYVCECVRVCVCKCVWLIDWVEGGWKGNNRVDWNSIANQWSICKSVDEESLAKNSIALGW